MLFAVAHTAAAVEPAACVEHSIEHTADHWHIVQVCLAAVAIVHRIEHIVHHIVAVVMDEHALQIGGHEHQVQIQQLHQAEYASL